MTWNVTSGEVTITAGNTYADKAHGLGSTPDINAIHPTPKSELTGYSFRVVSVDATNFRIAITGILGENAVFSYVIFYET